MEKPQLVSSEGAPLTINPSLPTILLVDDVLNNLELLEDIFEDEYNMPVAQTGEASWQLLQAYPAQFDAVLLDRMMPDIMGDEVLKRMMQNNILKQIPVIFQTAKITAEDIQEGFDLGANYYVTKPYERSQLLANVRAAIREYRFHKAAQVEMQKTANVLSAFSFVQEGTLTFAFRTLDQAQHLSQLLSHICADTKSILVGLLELCVNAVEHGIAQISYAEKSLLNEQNAWRQEVERRLSLPENLQKTATLRVDVILQDHHIEAIHFRIEDPGEGFDHEKYKVIDPARIFDSHGRGIAIGAVTGFDELIYNEKGNAVTAVVKIS